MAKFNEQNAFSPAVLIKYALYALVLAGALWAVGIWRWEPKNYACFSGWHNAFTRTQVVDYGSLHLYVWAVKRDCLLGKSDRYDPKQFRPANDLQTPSRP